MCQWFAARVWWPFTPVVASQFCSLTRPPSMFLIAVEKVCMSACPAHVGIVPKWPILKLFRHSDSPIIPGFWPLAQILNSKRNPVSGVVKYTGWEKFATFVWNRRLSRKRCEIARVYYGTLIRTDRWRIVTCRFRWPRVIFDPDFKVTTFFEVEYRISNILKTKLL